MTKTVNFRGKFDEIFTFPKHVCVLHRLTYHAAMCVDSVARDYQARNALVMWELVGDNKCA